MKNIRLIPLAVVSALLLGCEEDPLYTVDNFKEIDTEVELFKDGLEIPLGSSAVLRVDTLFRTFKLDSIAGDYLKVDADSNYFLQFKGKFDLDSIISSFDIANKAKVNAVSFSKSYTKSTDAFKPSDLSTTEQKFGKSVQLPSLSSLTEYTIAPVSTKIVDADAEMVGRNIDVTLEMEGTSGAKTLVTQSSLQTLASAASQFGDPTDIQVQGLTGIAIEKITQTIPGTALPSGVKAVKDVVLKEGAGVKFELYVDNASVFKSGTITPNIVADLSKVLAFKGIDGSLDLSSLVLDANNGYCASKTFEIDSVICVGIDKDRDISIDGTVDVTGASTSLQLVSGCQGDVKIHIDVSFVNFEVEDATCELKAISFSDQRISAGIKIPSITIPEQLKDIKSITTTDNSILQIEIDPSNLDQMPGLHINVDTLLVTFPDIFEISGEGVEGQQILFTDIPIDKKVVKSLHLDKINLPEPENGIINVSPEALAYVRASGSGTVKMSEIPKTSDKDFSISATVSADLGIKDFDIVTKRLEKDFSVQTEKISIKVPGYLASTFGSFKVTPEGSPAISLNMTVPDLGDFNLSAGEGIVIKLPKLFELGQVDTALHYDPEAGTIRISEFKTQSFSIPIESVNVEPVNIGGSYYIEGEYGVSGGIVAEETELDREGILKLSDALFDFEIVLPALQAKTVELEKFEFRIDETVDQNLLPASKVPEMVKSVGAVVLDDVNADISFNVSGLPDIGSGKYLVDLTATLPSVMTPSKIEIKGEVKNGVPFVISEAIESFDFSSYDLVQMRADGDTLKAGFSISGSVSATNPSVDVKTLSADVTASLNLKVAGPDGKIGLKSASANIGYQIDTAFNIPFLEEIKNYVDVNNFGLPTVTCVLGLESNLGFPLYCSAIATPFNKGGLWFNEAALRINQDGKFDIPYSIDPDVTDKTVNTVELPLETLANTLADSLRIELKAGIDPERECYVVPSAEYKVHADYDITAPLQFGSGLDISYSNAEFAIDPSLTSLLKDNAFALKMNIDNHLPFGVEIKVEFIDSLGNPLPCNEEYEIHPVIGIDKVSDVQIAFNPDPDVDMTKAKAVRISFNLTSSSRILRPDDYFQLKSASLLLPKGIVIPGNMLDSVIDE